MEKFDVTLITVGVLLLFGVLAYAMSRRVALPQVTILILLGAAVGPAGLDLLPPATETWYPLVSTLALLFVGFLVGGRLSLTKLREHGKAILGISISHVIVVTILVGGGLWLAGVQPEVALILAGISSATAPASVQSVVLELKADGPFTDTLLGVVAIDDAWGLIIFSILLVAAGWFGDNGLSNQVLLSGAWEIGGALLVGGVIGVPSAMLIRHLRAGQPMEAEALGVVLLAGGVAIWLDVSFLLAVMMLGAVVVNLAHNHDEPFDFVEEVEWPILVLFFILSGASLQFDELLHLGWIGGLYVALRSAGKIVGGWAGGRWGGMASGESWWMGLALQPQAGVALGMALVAGTYFPELADSILAIVIGASVFYEIFGPVLTRIAIRRAGEAGR